MNTVHVSNVMKKLSNCAEVDTIRHVFCCGFDVVGSTRVLAVFQHIPAVKNSMSRCHADGMNHPGSRSGTPVRRQLVLPFSSRHVHQQCK